ncbi:MAG: helix-turn-helix domain-containing protein [Rhodobacteraceae bacterium]|nr:helix-turn-helix domain-containing protein [Paracoccaceae bacterium]
MAFEIPDLLTSKEVAGILGVTAEHLANDRYKARQAGTKPLIPYIRLGERLVRYHPLDIERYLENQRVGA